MRQASRVAINRTIAGVHFPVDSVAGQVLGLALGEYFVHRARKPNAPGQYCSWDFIGTSYPKTLDFDWRQLYSTLPNQGTVRVNQPYATAISASEQAKPSPLLNALWEKAIREWP
jgi:hypothetical protein